MNSNKILKNIFLIGLLFLIIGLSLVKGEIKSKSVGVVQYKKEFVWYANRNGTISQQYFKPGQKFKKGEVLFVVQDPDLEMELNTLEQQILRVNYDLQNGKLLAEEREITGSNPDLQDVERLVDLQKDIDTRFGEIASTNDIALEKKFLSQREFHLERIRKIQNEISQLESYRLLRWKKQGYEEIQLQKHQKERRFFELTLDVLNKRKALLSEEHAALSYVAPFDGVFVDAYFEYRGERVSSGKRLAKIADVSHGYQIKTYLPERNIDLVQVGMHARMESLVYSSKVEGYLHGEVSSVINTRNVDSIDDTNRAYFETIIDVKSFPLPPSHGSRVEVDIILGEGNLISVLLNRPIRSSSTGHLK